MFESFLNNNLINTLASWSAVIISLGSLLWQWWRKRPRLKFFTDSSSPNVIFEYQPTPAVLTQEAIDYLQLSDDGIPAPARCLIFVQLENHSETSITISKATFYDHVSKQRFTTNHRVRGVKYFLGLVKDNPFTLDQSEQLPLPVIIPPYGVKYGYLIFPINAVHKTHGTLTLHSTCGDKHFPVYVDTFEDSYLKKRTFMVKTKKY